MDGCGGGVIDDKGGSGWIDAVSASVATGTSVGRTPSIVVESCSSDDGGISAFALYNFSFWKN
jgi:hypothetical protein